MPEEFVFLTPNNRKVLDVKHCFLCLFINIMFFF